MLRPFACSLRPDKTAAASLLNDFKDIPGKAGLNGVDNNDAFVNVGNSNKKNTLRMKSLCQKIKSHTCL